MFITGLLDSDSMPVLAAAAQFAARRQTLIANNIANISTPRYRNLDVSVPNFQKALGEAVDQRRRQGGGMRGPLELPQTDEVRFDASGNITLTPQTPSGGVLYQDRNDRDLERLMQDLAENTAAFRVATDLLKSRMDMLNLAIRERV